MQWYAAAALQRHADCLIFFYKIAVVSCGTIPNTMAMLVLQALRGYVAEQLGENSHQASRAAPGKEWVRGWDDSWK